MDNTIGIILPYAVEIIAALIIALIGVFGTWLLSKIKTKQNLTNIATATEQLITATQQTVAELQQTLVNSWKASNNGKLTEAQVKELQAKVLEKTQEKLAKPVVALLESAKVDVTAMITGAAENAVLEMKKG